MRLRCFTVMTAMLSMASFASAQEAQWILGAGVETDGTTVNAVPIISYQNGRFAIDLGEARYGLWGSETFALDATLGYGDGIVEGGFDGSYQIGAIEAGLSASHSFDGDGYLVTPSIGAEFEVGNVGVEASFGADVMDADRASALFGSVTAAHIVNPFIEFGFTVPVSETSAFLGVVTHTHYDRELAQPDNDDLVFGLAFVTSF